MRRITFLIAALLLLGEKKAFSQTEDDEITILQSTLSDISGEPTEEKTSITGQKDVFLRDAPATVSVITEEDILRSGSRDLMDVLRLVPGFEFGIDAQGVACLGVRGNSANEGGLLVMVDGMEMTEFLYASNQFGSVYPLEQIKKIEVIRGPGSVVYGGFAVFAVINIITKSSEDYFGFKVANTSGISQKGSQRQNFSASFGNHFDDFRYSVTAGMNSGFRSDGVYRDTAGTAPFLDDSSQTGISLLNKTRLTDRFISARLAYRSFTLKMLGDFYQIQNQTNTGGIMSKPYLVNFSTFNIDLRYRSEAKNKFKALPYLTMRKQSPWELESKINRLDRENLNPFHVHSTRFTGGSDLEYRISDSLIFQAHGGIWIDKTEDEADTSASKLNGQFSCINSSIQALWRTKFFLLSAGTRIDAHSLYRNEPAYRFGLSPRIALNKSIGVHHFKLSYNRSFRTPAMANIIAYIDRPENNISPQITNYFDFEYGVRPNNHLSLMLNLFHIQTRNGINYQVFNADREGYNNASEPSGTYGSEIQVFFRNEYGIHINGSWSMYRRLNAGSLPDSSDNLFFVPGSNLNLALPGHKLTTNIGFPVIRNLTLNGTLIYLSSRFAYNGSSFSVPFPAGTSSSYLRYNPVAQVNISLDWKDVFVKGLHLSAGVFDLFNSSYSLIQPYRSYHLPIPPLSRELTFRVVYSLYPEK
jgi:outer membrane cobalamin receptor